MHSQNEALRPAQELAALCQYAAQHPEFVQGAGGNCSVKAGGKLYVKASGYFLEDVTEKKGFAEIDLSSGKTLSGSPSLETQLHKFLGSYVIHTHPICAAALLCAEEGEKAMRALFPEPYCFWVPYATPGSPLAEKTRSVMGPQRPEKGALFLQNHGLFVWGGSTQEALAFHEEIIHRLHSFWGKDIPNSESSLPPENYLSPDHAVFGSLPPGQTGKNQRAFSEIQFFAAKTLCLMKRKRWTPRFLATSAVQELLAMEEEKKRQTLWKDAP